ncbi:BAHD1 family protein [Megaselia abdita]
MHQMHYPPAYPHNYYTPYPGDAMCYSPPYQPYFPAKVYPSSPAYRRFPSYYPPGHPPPHSELYETAPPPHPPQSSAQPPPTQSSSGPLVPTSHHSREHLEHAAGHSREHLVHAARHSRHAEHLEHYPGPPPAYYTSYSPAGAQCYPRTYMEYPPPPPCPCPMQQSCPKNAHTGPLIGSNSSNTGNNSQNTTIVNSSLSSPSITAPPTSAVTQSLNNTITTSATNTHGSNCNKTHNHTISSSSNNNSIMTSSIAITNNISNNGSPLENSSSVVVGINNNNNTTGKGSSNEKQLNTIRGPVKTINNNFDYEEAQYVNHIKAPCKLELDMTMATVPVKKEYIDVALDKDSQYEEDVVMPTTKTNALNNKIPEINTMIHTQIGRKARIGKTMAREMIHGNLTTAPVVVMKNSVAGLHDTSKTSQLVDLSKLTVKHIKQEEDIKKELNEEDDVVIVEDVSKKEPEIKVEPEIVDISGNVSTPPLVVINTDLSQDSSDVEITSYSPPQPKRIGILSCNNKPNTCTPKKSPNGYKSLIKQTEPKSYLVLSRKSDRKDRFGLLSKSKTVRRRKLVLTDQQKKRLKIQRKKRKALEKSKLAEEELKKENSKVVSSSSGRKSALDETIDFVARGYFSEPETSSPKALGRKAKKSKTNEARSKSESKKTTVSSESAKMLISNEQEIRRAKKSKETTNSPMEVVDITDSPTIHEDNNNCIRTNNNVDKPKPVFDDFKFIEPRVPPLRLTCSKRSRSRSKFGLKSKRSKRSKYLSAGIDEVIIPRRPDVVPKWNNGWTWEGEPFQRKIFLNSDEPYVVRTCYPAMRHQEGDVIRPRDCVLLKAGAKKNELPYVAKVAFLWENPTDGEMMMSLLWYYRPEHTEQGRMPIDASDEVFASKHRDHNSVACIEDKCYVLTYSEYCRYRRRLRAMEEDVDMNPSIVPSKRVPLAKPHHQVPVHTNPELVMFCQRVYEFRLKRLLKMPNT